MMILCPENRQIPPIIRMEDPEGRRNSALRLSRQDAPAGFLHALHRYALSLRYILAGSPLDCNDPRDSSVDRTLAAC